ncbi:MAG: glycosyltransferase [Xanthomonadales bacterium]|nr:glycosyltransferase family 2 protein [Xanthomonadales bacterium]NIX13248.1 glycosyltransferase [Xanthomonadales bacterium]
MSISALIVNFNAGEALLACVRALLDGPGGVRVTVADNASTDGSAERLRALYGDRADVEVVFNPTNPGFAAAVNARVKSMGSDWILIVNPDCEVRGDAVTQLREALEADKRAALAAPRVTDPEGVVEKACLRRFPDPWKSLVTFSGLWRLGHRVPWLRGVPVGRAAMPAGVVRAEAVSGACMMIRRNALEEVGYFDEAYTLHCEDLDLMYRLKQADWHCLFVPGATAVHAGGVSSRSRPLWVLRQKHRGMARFFEKFQASRYPAPVRWLVHAGIWIHFLVKAPMALVGR